MSKQVVEVAEGSALDNSFERLTLEAEQQLNCRVCGRTVWRAAFSTLFKKIRNKPAYEEELKRAMEDHRRSCPVAAAPPAAGCDNRAEALLGPPPTGCEKPAAILAPPPT